MLRKHIQVQLLLTMFNNFLNYFFTIINLLTNILHQITLFYMIQPVLIKFNCFSIIHLLRSSVHVIVINVLQVQCNILIK